jgi:hypothetical protein
MRLLLTLPLALALSVGAMAKDRQKDFDRAATVETLKAKMPSGSRFEVEDVRAGDGGFACVTYQVNDQEGRKQSRALVKGDQVLRDSNRHVHFDKAWNSKCSGA